LRLAIAKATAAGRRDERGANRSAELRGDALVGIEAEHPVVRRVRDCEVLLRTESLPRLHEHARAAAPGDFHGIIAAARIDDDDFTGKRRRREAILELAGRVARNHTKAQRKLSGHAHEDRSPARRAAREVTMRTFYGVSLAPLAARTLRGDRRVTAVLVVRPSSLGDIVHALALVSDVRQHRPDTAIDWVAEEAFAALVALDPGIRRIVPVALRRWRNHLFSKTAWHEMSVFRDDLRRDRYTAVLDLQEQVKGALISRLARGVRHGPDRASIREPIATLAHDVHHAIDPNQHLIDRCRELAARALGYRARVRLDSDSSRRRPRHRRSSPISRT
jgi:hypothetical protein